MSPTITLFFIYAVFLCSCHICCIVQMVAVSAVIVQASSLQVLLWQLPQAQILPNMRISGVLAG